MRDASCYTFDGPAMSESLIDTFIDWFFSQRPDALVCGLLDKLSHLAEGKL